MAKTQAITRYVPASGSPTIRVQVPQVPSAPKKGGGRRRRGGGGGGGSADITKILIGAGALGLAKKSGMLDKLPSLPVVGRIGAAAILCHFWAKHGGGPMVRDVSVAAAAISAYQLATQGSIDGDVMLGASLHNRRETPERKRDHELL